jgi:hypothetical protein
MHPLAEFAIRCIGTLLLLNLFSFGIWFVLRGRKVQLKLRKLRLVDGKITSIGRFFQASVSWKHLGMVYWGIDPSLYAFTTKEVIPLYISHDGTQYFLNIWTHNGKGQIGLGIFLCLAATYLAFILV